MNAMITRTYMVHFNTPAFLGNAEQAGQWRTPPFKHLLREWWRVAWVAAGHDPDDWKAMRDTEGRLFGHAWLKTDRDSKGLEVAARKSQVRLRLVSWAQGKLMNMPKTKAAGEGRQAVASHLYLGYGPVKSATELNMAHPLDPDKDQVSLKLAWPGAYSGAEYIEDALALIHAYGTLGGRSRNGWGSLALVQEGQVPALQNYARFLRPWRDCLGLEWSHAIGEDKRGALVWTTEVRSEWKAVIEDLASIRKQINSLAKRKGGRMVVNQPVAGKGGRVPSSLRFKVRRDNNTKDNNNGNPYYGVVFHMPYSSPGVSRQKAESVWLEIHDLLDQKMVRSAS